MAAAPSFGYKYISHPVGPGQMSPRHTRDRYISLKRGREREKRVGFLRIPMVSLEPALCLRERRASASPPLLRKRKLEEREEEHLPKELKLWKDDCGGGLATASAAVDLHLDTPLPPEWQRCLDIQSGKIHFYNTRTQRRTLTDPRRDVADEPSPADLRPVSLDLELNLKCETSPSVFSGGPSEERPDKGRPGSGSAAQCKAPSWGGGGGEMVAAVCGRCYMLVMMSRSSPSCPNCKFSHLPEDKQLPKPAARALVL